MAIFNMTTLGVAAAFCGTLAIGYIIYDRQLRPVGGKRKLNSRGSKPGSLVIPDFKDKYSLRKFFIEEIQVGEELLHKGRSQEAVDHFIKATAVCKQPDQLLPVIKGKIPSECYDMLLEGLKEVNVAVS